MVLLQLALQSSEKALRSFNYQAVISEIESKVSVFPPFPQPPPVDSSAVNTVIHFVSNFRKRLTSL